MHKDLIPLQLDIVKAINLGDYHMLMKLKISGMDNVDKDVKDGDSSSGEIDEEMYQK